MIFLLFVKKKTKTRFEEDALRKQHAFSTLQLQPGAIPGKVNANSERKRQLLKNEVVPWRSILIAAA